MTEPGKAVFEFPLVEQGLVSVIVPCYNQAGFLKECLESVLNQTYTAWECIVMDDGSVDVSAAIASLFCKADSRFSYYYQQNQGAATARNEAIRRSKGQFILPLDGDDKIGPDYLLEAVGVLKSVPSVKIVYCKAMLFGATNAAWKLPAYSMQNMLKQNVVFCTALYRRADYALTGGYNSNMKHGLEDWDFWLTMLEHGGEVRRLAGVHFFYRLRKNSRNVSMDETKYRSMLKQIFENHRILFETQGIDPTREWEKKIRGNLLIRMKRVLAKPYRMVFKEKK